MRECVGVDGGGGGEWRGIGKGMGDRGGGATGFNKKQHSECIVLSHRVKLSKGSLGFGYMYNILNIGKTNQTLPLPTVLYEEQNVTSSISSTPPHPPPPIQL